MNARLSWLGLAWLGVIIVTCILWSPVAEAHEVRPAFLQVTEHSNGTYDVLWKQPSQGQLAIRLAPHISGGILDGPPTRIESAPNFQIQTWIGLDLGRGGLDGRMLEIEGLSQTITDVLVSVSLANGDTIQDILRPQNPSITLRLGQKGMAVSAYLFLGIKHILTGADHLSFVFILLLLVRERAMLFKTITAFTIAHSLTLAATTLHLMSPRPAVVEALVAFSILFAATELVHHYRGRSGLTVRYPWLIAFTFGLLHGTSFAGALTEIGLPPDSIPLSLLLFNMGVEIGQLFFVAAVIGLGWLIAQLPGALPRWTRWVPPYALGTFAAAWFLERIETAVI